MTETKDINWEELYNSLKETVKILESKLDAAMRVNMGLEAEKRQWIQEQQNQQAIIAGQLTNSDSVVQQLQDEIRAIKKKYNIKD